MRQVKPIFKIQPLQIDTVKMQPMSAVPGIIKTPLDVNGTGLVAKTTLTRNANVPMPDGIYRVTVVDVGAVGVGSYNITDTTRGTTTGTILTSATKQSGLMPGIDIVVTDTSALTVGFYEEFEVVGDQTYIIPGTIVGRLTTGGEWKPATDALIASMDCFRVVMDFVETDKTRTVLPNGYEHNLSDTYTVDVVVYGQIYETVCNGINLTANLKAKLTTIAWL